MKRHVLNARFSRSAWVRRALVPVAVLALLPASAVAQECFGLARPAESGRLEVTGQFMRDGVTGPTTVGLSLAREKWWALVESGADLVRKTAAPTGGALAATGGVRVARGAATVCAGTSLVREVVSGSSDTALSFLGAGSFALEMLPTQPYVFGVMRYEPGWDFVPRADLDGDGRYSFRLGVATYPVHWIGVRGFGDFSGSIHRYGFSFSVSMPYGDDS